MMPDEPPNPPFVQKPGLTPMKLDAIAQAALGHNRTVVIEDGDIQFATRIRRLSEQEMTDFDFPGKLVPPLRVKADGTNYPPDAAFEERYNTEEPGYVKEWNTAFEKKTLYILDAAVEGGVPGDDDEAKLDWMRKSLTRPLKAALLREIVRISTSEILQLANFCSPAA